MDRDFWRAQPLLFGHVREDASTERWLIEQHGCVRRAVVIASGGCTALSLASLVGERLDAIDVNPRQIALTDLKIAALRKLDRPELLRLLGESMSPRAICRSLDLDPNARRLLDELPDLLPRGLQNSGRVDRMMNFLRQLLFRTVHRRAFVEDFLHSVDITAQGQRFDQEWDTARWQVATKMAFNRFTLALAFGTSHATRLPVSFAADVRQKVRHTLTAHPCLKNGHVWQDFLGCYPAGIDSAWPWFAQAANHETSAMSSAKIRTHATDISSWLAGEPDRSIDFFGLSNILELAPASTLAPLLNQVSRTATPRAVVCLRSILPFGKIPDQPFRLKFHAALTAGCASRERALICNRFEIHVADSFEPAVI